MPAQLGMQNDVTRRNHARGGGAHDYWVRTAEGRRLQAEAIAKGVHWVWTSAPRIAERLMNGTSPEGTAAPNGREFPATLAAPRYSLNSAIADAISRGVLRLAGLVRRSILEPYARRRRRRIAIAQLRRLDDHLLADIGLTRGQIELAVDGMLPRHGKTFSLPVGRGVPAEEARHDLPTAA